MVLKIGHATADEFNASRGGRAGDQTKEEILIQTWYYRKQGWTAVFRAKNKQTAEIIASTMEQACMNNNIGYDQGQRTTLFEQAKKLNWNISKIATPCECDCSSLVAVCVNAAGITVDRNMYTGNQKELLMNTGCFDMLTNKKYLTTPDYLNRGDILLGPGHTAVVLGQQVTVDKAKSFLPSLAGLYKVSATKLNIRSGAGINKSIITVIPKGTKVRCYGYYTEISGTCWLYIQFKHNDKQATGYASMRYLIK